MGVHIIGEAGSNHGGDVNMANKLVDLAARAKVDSVKFQFIDPEELYLPWYRSGEKLERNAVYDQRLKEQISEAGWREVWRHAESVGVSASTSVFGPKSIRLAMSLGCPYLKIASTDLNNHRLISLAVETGRPLVVSTGMSTLSQIESAINVIQRGNAMDRLTLLHCVSVYPCPLELANVSRVKMLRDAFGVSVGFSDHTEGSIASCCAVMLGVTLIEKHFTCDPALPGFDHKHAAGPEEIQSFVRDIRAVEQQLAEPRRASSPKEDVTKVRARRGIYVARDLPQGHVITPEDLLCVRPTADLSPEDLPAVVGSTLAESVPQYAPLSMSKVCCLGGSRGEDANAYWKSEMAEKSMFSQEEQGD